MSIKRGVQYKNFGKFVINYDKLIFNQILLMRYKSSHGPIDGYKNKMKISILLADVLAGITDNIVHYDLIEKLKYNELLIMEEIIRRSNMISELDYKRPKHDILINQIKQRLTVLQGSFSAGNENILINKECLDMISILYDYGELTEKNYYILKASLE